MHNHNSTGSTAKTDWVSRCCIIDILPDMMNVTWEAVEVFGCRRTLRYDLDVYNIKYGQKVLSYTTTGLSYFTPSVLNCSTGYKWCIRSKNEMGASTWNCELVVETNSTVPQRVCSMSVVEVNAVSIQLQWEPPCNLCGGTDIKYDVKIKKKMEEQFHLPYLVVHRHSTLFQLLIVSQV